MRRPVVCARNRFLRTTGAAERAARAQLRAAERRAARCLGLEYVHGAPDIERASEYAALLAALAARGAPGEEGEGGGDGGEGSGSGAVLLVSRAPGGDAGACTLDEVSGTLRACVHAAAGDVAQLVAECGYQAPLSPPLPSPSFSASLSSLVRSLVLRTKRRGASASSRPPSCGHRLQVSPPPPSY
jgi:hypothetical protein